MHLAWQEYLNAFRNVTRQYRRSLFGIAAVTFGVVALLLAAGFVEWIFWAGRDGAIKTGLGHVQVMRPGYLEGGAADPMHYLMPAQSAEMDAIAHFPGVRTFAPRLALSGLISRGDMTISFIGEGGVPEAEQQIFEGMPIPEGQGLASADPNGIILGYGLAQNLGAKVGDTVVLLANTPSKGLNAVECTVRGLFATTSKAYDDSALRVPLPLAQKLLRVSGTHRWVLLLDHDDDEHTAAMVRALRAKFPGGAVEFVPWYDMADFYNKMVILLSRQVGVVEFIIAAIIVLSISNTMMMNVLERTAEIGTCLAMGRRRRQILRQFVYEGLTIGLIGGLAGVCLGWLLANGISFVGIPMPPPPGMSQGYSGRILVTVPLVLNAFSLAVCTTLVASLYPAWIAARMEIVDALRHSR